MLSRMFGQEMGKIVQDCWKIQQMNLRYNTPYLRDEWATKLDKAFDYVCMHILVLVSLVK